MELLQLALCIAFEGFEWGKQKWKHVEGYDYLLQEEVDMFPARPPPGKPRRTRTHCPQNNTGPLYVVPKMAHSVWTTEDGISWEKFYIIGRKRKHKNKRIKKKRDKNKNYRFIITKEKTDLDCPGTKF